MGSTTCRLKENNVMSVKVEEGWFNFQMREVLRIGDWFCLIFSKERYSLI